MGMFSGAKVIKAPSVAAKGKQKLEVEIPGLELNAQIDIAIKALTALKSPVRGEVQTACMAQFMEIIAKTGAKPDSFRGIDGDSSSSIELRKRSSLSKLNPAEIDYLTTNNVPFAKSVKTIDAFIINPIYTSGDKMDTELLARVEVALDGIVPEDFLVKQEEVSTSVVSEETLAYICKNFPNDPVMLNTGFVFAIKATLKDVNLKNIFTSIIRLISTNDQAAAAITDAGAAVEKASALQVAEFA